MAWYIANGTGNFNTAGTWDTVTNTPTINATTNIAVTAAGNVSETFTAPNTTNAVTGVAVYMSVRPTVGNFTAELEESTVPTGRIATINLADLPSNLASTSGSFLGCWIYFRLATPYVFTTTTAGAYRWRFKNASNSGSLAFGTTAIALMSTDDRHTAPTTTDQVIIAPHNCTTGLTVTVDGTAGDVRGSGTNTGSPRQVTFGCIVGGAATDSLAVLKWDTAANSALSVQGMTFVHDGGEIQMGTVATSYPSSLTATLTCRQGSGGTNTGIMRYGTGKLITEGRPLTYPSTTIVSGVGTAASPLVVADAASYSVGDRLMFPPVSNSGTNYNETEYRFIITVNSPTSYVLSLTSGGAEAALTFTHGPVVNIQRNVNIVPSVATQMLFTLYNPASGYVNLEWTTIRGQGSVAGTPTSVGTNNIIYGMYLGSTGIAAVNYCVFDTPLTYGWINDSGTAQTYTGNVFCGSGAGTGSTTATLAVGVTAVGHTFINNWHVGNTRQGIEYRGVNCTFTSPYVAGNNTGGTAANGGFYIAQGAPVTITGENIHANRIGGYVLAGTSNSTSTNGKLGTVGYNGADVFVVTNSSNSMLLTNCMVGSPTTATNYVNGAANATLVAFHRLNNTANNHQWYTEYGSARSTGAGLVDTTVRTSGTLNVRLAPENTATGFSWSYKVLAKPNTAVQSFIFINKNATFGASTATVELFLPGSTVADSTATVVGSTGVYNVYAVAANYLGTENLYATVKITAKSATAGAYIYLADISNGTNNIINFNTWDRGQPSPIMFEQLGDAGAVWSYLLDGSFTAGQLQVIPASTVGGKLSGAGTGTEVFRNPSDTKNVVTATVDSSGNRTAITYNVS